MENARRFRIAIAALCMLALASAAPASARRASAASGMPTYVDSAKCFVWAAGSNGGVALSPFLAGCTANNFIPFGYAIPLHLDSGGAKTVALTVRQTAASTLACALVEQDTAGNSVEVVNYDPFPVGAAYVTRSETITVGNSNNLTVQCTLTQWAPGVEGVRILSVSY